MNNKSGKSPAEIYLQAVMRCSSILLHSLLMALPLAAAETRQGRVLVLGDSISVGYTPQVRDLLRDMADVIRPTGTNGNFENCEGTTKGVKEISRWLQYDGGRWDVIHFNFGLHDLKRVNPRSRQNSTQSSHPRQAEPDVYERQLREILRALKGTGARLIMATTTPVPSGPLQPLRDPADVERYNRIAQRLAEEEGITVNDLYSFSRGRLADWQRPVNVHFNEKGNQAIADRVARSIRQGLAQALGRQLRTQAPPANVIPTFLLALNDPGLEVTLWAAAPMLRHPTHIDFDPAGRLWLAEGVNYRQQSQRQSESDRIMILEDIDQDGRADRTSVFVEERFLRSPTGIAVIDNQVLVSMAPDLVVYTDVNRDRKFDARVDRREVSSPGFNSYAQAETSFGDVFENDNDDDVCRTIFLMEGGNTSFGSLDSQRPWQAQWRQEPGARPVGNAYGGGVFPGIAFVEDSALGPKCRGLLLSCDSARNTVLGSFPKPDGAGFKLELFDFLTSNPEKEFAGTNGKGKVDSPELKTCFRPSDVAVGPDGAIYVSDFFDARIGGGGASDKLSSGAIYRIAPKNFKPRVPPFDWTTRAGAIAALQNPALNVRTAAQAAVLTHHAQANDLAKLLVHENPYVRARAIGLLPQLGPEGIARAQRFLRDRDPQIRVTTFRALRRYYETAGPKDLLPLRSMAEKLAADSSPAVRREVALAMRGLEWAQAKEILVTLARGYNGQDRFYLEALGAGAQGKESQFYDAVLPFLGHPDPLQWTGRFTGLAWRLHPPQSAFAFRERALAVSLPERDQRAALTALASIGTREAVQAIVEAAARADQPAKADALWFLLNRKDNVWKEFALDAELKRRGIYDPDAIELQATSMPEPALLATPTLTDVLGLKGNAKRGRDRLDRCTKCHRIGAQGHDVGPDLSAFGQARTREMLVQSIVDPSADIAHGFGASEILTTDGLRIEGLIVSDGNPAVILCAGGLTQLVPPARIKSKKPLGRSLMWTPRSLGLEPQDVADVVEYLRSVSPRRPDNSL